VAVERQHSARAHSTAHAHALFFLIKKRCPYSVVFSLLIIIIDSLGSFKKIIVSRKLSTIIIQVPGDGADANSAEDYPHQT